jgi:NAD(P)-dependent dehydrogenase (short-subunit alcohol dehydrogenase family)
MGCKVVGHILVAGGSSGIGAACRDLFLAKGWHVTSVARRAQMVDAAYAPRFHGVALDLLQPDAAQQAIGAAESVFGPVNSVLHAVGDIAPAAGFSDIGWNRWRETYDLVVGTAVDLARAALPALVAAGDNASVTLIASVAAHKPYPGIPDYCAAKAALVSLGRSLAAELAPTRGRANCISPAVVRTPLFDRAPFDEAAAASWHKLGRIGEPAEVAEMAFFLANAGWVTGQDCVMDGGMLL